MRIVDINEMKEIENLAGEEYQFDERLIIENVGSRGAEIIKKKILNNSHASGIIFLIGRGNNGADGLAIARHLTSLGYSARAFLLFPKENRTEELNAQLQMAKAFGVKINRIEDIDQLSSYCSQLAGNIIFIDAVFGTGVRLPLSNFLYEVIDFVNTNSSYTISVDIPSGVEGDTGFIQGKAVNADLTLAVGLPKLGYYEADGVRLVGEVEVMDVGFPRELLTKGNKFLLRLEDVIDPANRRDKFADKKVFGHALCIGGSHGLTGALVMASQAALKVGAGVVTAVTWEPQYREMIERLIPEVMTGYVPLDTARWPNLIKNLNKYSSIVIGPGLARSTRARRLVLEVLNNFNGPVVLDADAINVLKLEEDKNVFTMRNAPTVLTPHLGEFARFYGVEYQELERRPVEYLKSLVDQINCSVILKGPCTYLGFSDGNVFFNYYPNDGMATGGVGDVLAGVLGGLLGQDPELKDASVTLSERYEIFNQTIGLAVLAHTMSGHFAAEKLGVRAMTALSLADYFPQTFQELEKQIEKIIYGE
ncbi:MAG: NAD(P)H-hydrate dehydratase [Bacteriovoracaceae bacterium]